MHRNVLTALLAVLLVVGLLVPAISSSHQRRPSSGGMKNQAIEFLDRERLAGIVTFGGVQNPHKRGLGCYGCHTEGPPPAKVASAPEEPCADCHPRLTDRQMKLARQFCATGPVCPVTYGVRHRPSGQYHYWFFGLR